MVQGRADLRERYTDVIVGALTWVAFLVVSALPGVHLSLIDLLLVFAPLVVVPLSRPLVVDAWFPPPTIVFGAGVSMGFAFVPAGRGAAGWLALPWLAVAAAILAAGVFRWSGRLVSS